MQFSSVPMFTFSLPMSFTERWVSDCVCPVFVFVFLKPLGWVIFLGGKRRVWKQHKSKWSETANQGCEQTGGRSAQPQPSLALGTPQQSPGRGDKGAILFPPGLAPFQRTSSCSLCLWDIYSAPSPRHQTKKNMLTGLAPRHFFWPGSRKEGDPFVWEIRNKVSGGCDLWQK